MSHKIPLVSSTRAFAFIPITFHEQRSYLAITKATVGKGNEPKSKIPKVDAPLRYQFRRASNANDFVGKSV